jgi:hypothetical protein
MTLVTRTLNLLSGRGCSMRFRSISKVGSALCHAADDVPRDPLLALTATTDVVDDGRRRGAGPC